MEWLTKEEMRNLKKGDLIGLDDAVDISGNVETVGWHLHNNTYEFRDWFNEQIENKRYFTRSTYFYIKKIIADESNYRFKPHEMWVYPEKEPDSKKLKWSESIKKFLWGQK